MLANLNENILTLSSTESQPLSNIYKSLNEKKQILE